MQQQAHIMVEKLVIFIVALSILICAQQVSQVTITTNIEIEQLKRKYSRTFYQYCNGVEYRIIVRPTDDQCLEVLNRGMDTFDILSMPCDLPFDHVKEPIESGSWLENIEFK